VNPAELTPEQRRIGWALLLIRLAAAVVFIYHGSAILFGAFGGPGVAGFAQHLQMPNWVAALVGLAQFLGGISVLTGVLARLGALAIIPVMVGAIVLVHWQHGFDITKQGMEYALTQLLIALAILVAGAGPFSLVYLFWPAGRPLGRGEFAARTPQPPPAPQV